MAVKSSAVRYGSVAIILHWVSAILVIGLLISGLVLSKFGEVVSKEDVLRMHVVFGGVVGVLTFMRIGWWVFFDKKPVSVGSAGMVRISKFVHGFMYVALVILVGSGIGMMVLSGAGDILFGGIEWALPDFWDYLPRRPHFVASRVLIGLVVLHVAGVLVHYFYYRDQVMGRMWFGR